MSKPLVRAVFLDRDGVINRAILRNNLPYPPRTLAELELLPGVEAALQRLKGLGFLLLVVTNQPDVARGQASRETVDEMHGWLSDRLPIDEFFTCWHDDHDHCHCRKPKPGLLLDGAQKYSVSLADSYLVGDRWRDVDAGAAAGVRTVFLDGGYAERGPSEEPDARVRSMEEAAAWIEQDARQRGQ